MLKRGFDVVCATLGILVSLPLCAVIAIGIVTTSRGPIFFRQERIGKGFRPFLICKFRTMHDGATGPLITAGGDKRVTGFGRLLRRTKLDELPQLWNVLVGDMSLVGPRPEVAKYVARYRSDYEEILAVRPGITDNASLAFRDEGALLENSNDPEREYLSAILPRKIEMAKRYVRSRSFVGDLIILSRTLLHL